MTDSEILELARKYGDVRGGGPASVSVSFTNDGLQQFARRIIAMPIPVGEIVTFGKDLKEVSWHKGKMPPEGTKLYAAPQPPQNAADHIVDANKKVDADSVPVAIYQVRLANGSWQDINERAYQYNLTHCPEDSRIVYAAPQPSQPEAQSVRDAERYRYLTSRVVMTDASTPGIMVITFVDDAIDEPNQFLDEIVDAGLKSAPPQKPVSDEVKP